MPQPALENIRIATPCPASWEQMRGDDRVRHCDLCKLNVYNFSAMTRTEAEALLQAHAGQRLCGRLYRRADGTILTQDCPTGLRAVRRRVAQRAGVALSVLLGLFGGAFGQEKKTVANADAVRQEQKPPGSRAGFTRKTTDNTEAAALEGVLYDINGAVIAGARVWLIDEKTKEYFNTMSDGGGKFSFVSLKPDSYTLGSSSPGFQPLKMENLEMKAAELVKTEITLEAYETTIGVIAINEELPIETNALDQSPVIVEKPKIKLPKKPND